MAELCIHHYYKQNITDKHSPSFKPKNEKYYPYSEHDCKTNYPCLRFSVYCTLNLLKRLLVTQHFSSILRNNTKDDAKTNNVMIIIIYINKKVFFL